MLQPDMVIEINRVDSIGGAQWLQKSRAEGNKTPWQMTFHHMISFFAQPL